MNKKIAIIIFFISLMFIPVKTLLAESGTFTELQLLINENPTGKLILEKDYTNNGSEPQITITKDIILDLNGHVINGRYVNRIFYVSNDAHLTIDDSNKTAIHKFKVDEWLLATLNEDEGAVTVYGGCITAGDVTSGSTNKTHLNGKGSGIYINSGSLTINSGNIIGNKISDKFQFGSGIAAENNSKITINGGMVSYNRATWEGYGGGIYLNNSDLIINGGTISYNYGIYGGGINAYDASSVTMNGGNISNNTGGHNGAGISLMVYENNIPLGYVSKAIINGGTIENNTVATPLVGVGGGISTDKSTDLTINGGTIQKNTAYRGGGIGAWTGGNIKIYGGVIKENISKEDTEPSDGTTGNYGAGVFFNTYFISGYGSVNANLTIGGNAIITENINDVTKKEDNVYLANGQKINIGTDKNAPTNKMNIGINMENVGVFTTNGTEAQTKYFYSDDPVYEPVYDNDSLKLDTKAYTYEIISGKVQTFTKGKIKKYTFEIDGNYLLFNKLEIGELTLEKDVDYKITRGSTIVTFTQDGIDKLNTLDIGTYEVKAKYTNTAEAVGSLIIEKEIINPKTLDNIYLYMILSLMCVILGTKLIKKLN